MVTLTRSHNHNTSLQPHFHYSPPPLLVTVTSCHHKSPYTNLLYTVTASPTHLSLVTVPPFVTSSLPIFYLFQNIPPIHLPHPVSLQCLCAMHLSLSGSQHLPSTSYTPPYPPPKDPLANPSPFPMVCVWGCSLVSLPWALDGLVPALAAGGIDS